MAEHYDILIEQGAIFALPITVIGVDLSSYTMRGQMRTTHADTAYTSFAVTSFTYAGGNSTASISLAAGITATMPAPSSGVYDVEYFLSSLVVRLIEGSYSITPEVTR